MPYNKRTAKKKSKNYNQKKKRLGKIKKRGKK